MIYQTEASFVVRLIKYPIISIVKFAKGRNRTFFDKFGLPSGLNQGLLLKS